MQNLILTRLVDGSKAVITHWDHFYVNRSTGSTIDRAFTIKYLDGDYEGQSHCWSIHSLHTLFHIVGKNEVSNDKIS